MHVPFLSFVEGSHPSACASFVAMSHRRVRLVVWCVGRDVDTMRADLHLRFVTNDAQRNAKRSERNARRNCAPATSRAQAMEPRDCASIDPTVPRRPDGRRGAKRSISTVRSSSERGDPLERVARDSDEIQAMEAQVVLERSCHAARFTSNQLMTQQSQPMSKAWKSKFSFGGVRGGT